MHRIDRRDLENALFVQIKTMRIGRSRGGKHPIEELRDDATIRELVRRMVNVVDCANRFVCATGPHPMLEVRIGYEPLAWGQDEPWPEGCAPGSEIPVKRRPTGTTANHS